MIVVLSSNPYRDHGLHAAQRAQKILESCGVECRYCLPFELAEGAYSALPVHVEVQPIQQAMSDCNAIICFGGDGTILHAARHAAIYGVPLLGVNMGSVGFMAELEENELDELTRLAKGDYTIQERMMLKVQLIRGDKVISEKLALNDAVLSKSNVARVAGLELLADNVPVYQLSGDGVVISTPTGATAYSMSAGGPIVEPSLDSIIVTPVCAHQLAVRPMIIAPERTVTVQLQKKSRKKSVYLSADGGRAVRVTGSDRVNISMAQCRAQLIRLSGKSFYERLNQKLGGYAL